MSLQCIFLQHNLIGHGLVSLPCRFQVIWSKRAYEISMSWKVSKQSHLMRFESLWCFNWAVFFVYRLSTFTTIHLARKNVSVKRMLTKCDSLHISIIHTFYGMIWLGMVLLVSPANFNSFGLKEHLFLGNLKSVKRNTIDVVWEPIGVPIELRFGV